MIQDDNAARLHSVISRFLFCPASASTGSIKSLVFDGFLLASLPPSQILIPAPKEKIKLYSSQFYAACIAGGIASCGLTHLAVTPLDLVKCNIQVNVECFRVSISIAA